MGAGCKAAGRVRARKEYRAPTCVQPAAHFSAQGGPVCVHARKEYRAPTCARRQHVHRVET
jgi:hypothetical protein